MYITVEPVLGGGGESDASGCLYAATTNLLSHNEQRRHEKWRKLQRRALRIPLSVFAVKSVLIMNPVCDTPPGRRAVRDPTAFELRRKLEELIAALARRIPHHERAGEAAILG